MLPMYLHSKEPLRQRALKKKLKVRCLFAYPEEGTVEPRRQHQMPLVKLGVNEGGGPASHNSPRLLHCYPCAGDRPP